MIITSAMKGQTNFHGVHRNLKHLSVVACISAASEHMTPFCVFSQVNPTVERQLKSEWLRLAVDLILEHRNKPDMSSQLFAVYISTVLLPYIDELQSNEEFADQEEVRLLDNCSIHVHGDTLQMLADHRVKVLTFPPTQLIFFKVLI
jgi:hypothetical protein